VKLLDGGVQLAGDVGNGLSGIRFSEHRLENITDLPGGNAAQKNNTDSDLKSTAKPAAAWESKSVLAAPIVDGGSVVGLIEVFSRQNFAFDDSDCHALDRLAETVADSMTASRWLGRERERDNLLPGTAVSTGVAPPSNVSAEESSPLTSLLVPAGYKFSFGEKLMLHKRAGQWAVAGIVLAAGLWLAFGILRNGGPIPRLSPLATRESRSRIKQLRTRANLAVWQPRAFQRRRTGLKGFVRVRNAAIQLRN